MADDQTSGRGTGRSRTERAKSPRRNVTVPLDEETYDLMRRHAEDAGLSISRFGEQAIKDSIFVTAFDEAVRKAMEEYDDKTVEHFNGKLGFCFAKFSSDVFVASVSKQAEGYGQNDFSTGEKAVTALSDAEFRKAIEVEYLSRREDIFREIWAYVDGMAAISKLSGILKSMDPAERAGFFQDVARAVAGKFKKEGGE